MRSRPLFSECRIFYDIGPGEAPPTQGEYVVTQTKRGPGSAYAIDAARQNRNRPQRWHLTCRRWPLDQIPDDATVRPLYWYPREPRRGRR